MSRRGPDSSTAAHIYSVGELTHRIAATLDGLPPAWVGGELSNVRVPSSGHCYFQLRDDDAAISCVLWRSTRRHIEFDLEDGLEVVLFGELTVYPPRGAYQLVVSAVEPKGVGAQQLALRKLVAKLRAAGLLDDERKRAIPEWPRTVALVTAARSAAIEDLRRVLRRRWPAARVLIRDVRVQGAQAPGEIVQALADVGAARDAEAIDVVIVGRGGGSKEDLSAWNDEGVARAIAGCPVPVVSAVGHEIDVTVADLVADLRAATPSEAAELVVPDRLELADQVQGLEHQLHHAMRERLDDAGRHLRALAESYALRHPAERVRQQQQRCDDLGERLNAAARARLQHGGERLRGAAGRLESLSPLKVLGRGYSVTQADGRALLDPADAPAGTALRILLHRGALRARSEGGE